MAVLPAATARALLAAFRALGLDANGIRAAAGISAEALEPFDGALPERTFEELWKEAFRRAPREELPTEVGLALPFGAFGALDYLAASAATVEAAFGDLAGHFRYAAEGFRLEVARTVEGGEVRLVPCGPVARGDRVREVSDEFTLAVFVGRFRSRAVSPPFRANAVRLTRPPPVHPTTHEALLRAPVLFGCAVAAIEVPLPAWTARLGTADPELQATLRQLADRIGLGAAASDLEASVRARLRALLPGGAPEAARVAGSLGLSERTLHRRLHAQGRTFREVLERFREAEAERLLSAGTLSLSEVALRLGFSDQTAWNRAFRRWKGMAPRAWLASRSARAAPPPSAPALRSPARPGRRRS
ncbi:MAG TPA: AraC family transcriptional regulator ligand-binding domain-containing protein [Anaeromyxobacter sp.]